MRMKKTRFRAYQLGDKGSSFSYTVDDNFTLIEARFNATNAPSICHEMKITGASNLANLHITGWDKDHCSESELPAILEYLKPEKIQYPGYEPDTDCGKACKRMIEDYCTKQKKVGVRYTPDYVNGLSVGKERGYSTIIYNPIDGEGNHNDNSIAALFRAGRFTVLSLGDCESEHIAKRIQMGSMAANETDVLILAHHGANNGFTTDEFIKAIKPSIAICSSNYDNQYEHPRGEVRQILHQNNVHLFTTKTGDVIVECNEDNKVHVKNLVSNNTKINSSYTFTSRCIVSES